jgi:3D (Asp-Asp-Asp) domain-containing protein
MKILENIIIIGIIGILGFGIYLNTTHFIKEISETKSEPIEEKIEEGPAIEQVPSQSTEKPEEKEEKVEESPKEEEHHSHTVSLGVYKITAYCGCAKCCGKTDGITASGTHVTAGRTIAAPPDIPFGTQIIINGHTYTVEDRGGAIKGKRIDIYFETHEEALAFGVQNVEIFKVIK